MDDDEIIDGLDDCRYCCNGQDCGCYGECINEHHYDALAAHSPVGITATIKESGPMEKIEIEMPGTAEIAEAAATRLASHLHERMGEAIAEKAGQLLVEKIDGEVARIVAENIGATVRPVNEFGEPTSVAPKTVKEIIAERVQAWMTERVGHDGRPGNGYHSQDLRTRCEWAIYAAVGGETAKQIKAAVEKAARDTQAQILGSVQEMVATTVARLLKLPGA